MLIIDSQVHIWEQETEARPWPQAHGQRPRAHREVPITAESLLLDMKAAGVDQAILVPPSWEGDRNDLVTEAARRYPDRFRYAARLDLAAPSARNWIENWRQKDGALALQLTFQTPLFQRALLEGALDWLWPLAERAGLPLTIYIPNRLMPLMAAIAQRHPDLRIIMNHFGLAGTGRDAAAFEDFGQLLALAPLPNIAVKASCIPFYTTEPYPFPGVHDYIRQAFEVFGPRRLFWGTDLSRLPCSYREGVTLFTEELPWLKGGDLEWVMGRGIAEWLDWRPAP
ncbi:amidohydrolase [Bordetella sp. BOR01]|uniref:amidohydrolase family protein n=1 Tax=Bordetella sp. BOR01 TaxID=2854779 RepID=UPI001C4581AB|nr:amidohydrolase family protein [Bordetella sp. BOR01]MBV7482763.1 amidohydrolase [Bordetella sp. BOR01]